MSKKSHRRQAKPAAVQAYPVSDALGDVLSRALTAFDRADPEATARVLPEVEDSAELIPHPYLRMFVCAALRLPEINSREGAEGGLRQLKKVSKALGLAHFEGLPALAVEVLSRRLTISTRNYDLALRGLDDLIATLDRGEASTGSPVFDRYLQRCAHETRYLAETGSQSVGNGPSPIFEHGHFVEDLPFGDASWHPRLITRTTSFVEQVQEASETRLLQIDADDNDGFFKVLDETRSLQERIADRTFAIVLPQLRAESFGTFPADVRVKTFANLSTILNMFENGETAVQAALALEFLQKPGLLVVPKQWGPETAKDIATTTLAGLLLSRLASDEPLKPQKRSAPEALRTPAFERWQKLLGTETLSAQTFEAAAASEPVPALQDLYRWLAGFMQTISQAQRSVAQKRVDQAHAEEVLRRLKAVRFGEKIRAADQLRLLAETYGCVGAMLETSPAFAEKLRLAAELQEDAPILQTVSPNPLLREEHCFALIRLRRLFSWENMEDRLSDIDFDDGVNDDFEGGEVFLDGEVWDGEEDGRKVVHVHFDLHV